MSEEGKVRLLVIPIVAMLAVTMVVAGWQYEESIEWEKGYQELEVDYRENIVEETDLTDKYYENKTTTAVTTVNNESTLELTVEMFMSSMTGEGNYETKIRLSAEGEFSSDLEPDEIRLTAQGLDGKDTIQNVLDFRTSQNEVDNASVVSWEEMDKHNIGGRGTEEAFQTFEVDGPEFSTETEITITISEENIGNEYSYEFQAILGGLSEEVSSTVEVTFLER